jgi:uncharacterized protein YeaO (DUF488 family)
VQASPYQADLTAPPICPTARPELRTKGSLRPCAGEDGLSPYAQNDRRRQIRMRESDLTRPIAIERVYGDPGRRRDELRVLVDRLWPRGVAKGSLDYDEWAKDLAPSTGLRRWYGHDPARFKEFDRRYRVELEDAPAQQAIRRLRAAAPRRGLTLLTATRDVEHSGAAVLQAVIEDRPTRTTGNRVR